jgi:hypothetical protein
MARFRTRPINAFLKKVMTTNKWERLGDVCREKDIPVARLSEVADITEDHPIINAHIDMAEKLGIPLEEWLRGLVNRPKPKGEDERAAS